MKVRHNMWYTTNVQAVPVSWSPSGGVGALIVGAPDYIELIRLASVTSHPTPFYRWRQGPEDELWLEEPCVLSAQVQLLHLIHSSTLAANLLECSTVICGLFLELVRASETMPTIIYIFLKRKIWKKLKAIYRHNLYY